MQKPSRILAAQKFLSTAENDSRFCENAFVGTLGPKVIVLRKHQRRWCRRDL